VASHTNTRTHTHTHAHTYTHTHTHTHTHTQGDGEPGREAPEHVASSGDALTARSCNGVVEMSDFGVLLRCVRAEVLRAHAFTHAHTQTHTRYQFARAHAWVHTSQNARRQHTADKHKYTLYKTHTVHVQAHTHTHTHTHTPRSEEAARVRAPLPAFPSAQPGDSIDARRWRCMRRCRVPMAAGNNTNTTVHARLRTRACMRGKHVIARRWRCMRAMAS
jgi:hypothetical protein